MTHQMDEWKIEGDQLIELNDVKTRDTNKQIAMPDDAAVSGVMIDIATGEQVGDAIAFAHVDGTASDYTGIKPATMPLVKTKRYRLEVTVNAGGRTWVFDETTMYAR